VVRGRAPGEKENHIFIKRRGRKRDLCRFGIRQPPTIEREPGKKPERKGHESMVLHISSNLSGHSVRTSWMRGLMEADGKKGRLSEPFSDNLGKASEPDGPGWIALCCKEKRGQKRIISTKNDHVREGRVAPGRLVM